MNVARYGSVKMKRKQVDSIVMGIIDDWMRVLLTGAFGFF